MLKSLLMASALTMALSGAAMAQNQRFPPPGSTGPMDPGDDFAALYNAIPSDPIMSTAMVSDAELATASARSPESRETAAQVRNDPCADTEMREICNYAGAETIRKIRTLNWVTATAGSGGEANRVDGGPSWKYRLSKKFGYDIKTNTKARMASNPIGDDAERMELSRQVLDYGIQQNLQRHYGQKGASDEQETVLNGGAGTAAKLVSTSTRSGFGCGQDEKDINFGLGSTVFFPKHRLTMCRAYFAKRLAWWVWSIEGAVEVSHSRFARKVLLWVPTGAETIAANSILAGSGNLQTNTNKYYSPISLKVKFVTNSSPMSINADGSAASLATGFNVSM